MRTSYLLAFILPAISLAAPGIAARDELSPELAELFSNALANVNTNAADTSNNAKVTNADDTANNEALAKLAEQAKQAEEANHAEANNTEGQTNVDDSANNDALAKMMEEANAAQQAKNAEVEQKVEQANTEQQANSADTANAEQQANTQQQANANILGLCAKAGLGCQIFPLPVFCCPGTVCTGAYGGLFGGVCVAV